MIKTHMIASFTSFKFGVAHVKTAEAYLYHALIIINAPINIPNSETNFTIYDRYSRIPSHENIHVAN